MEIAINESEKNTFCIGRGLILNVPLENCNFKIIIRLLTVDIE